MTCLYKCGNACAHPGPTSDNGYFRDIVEQAISRRGLLKASAARAAGAAVAGLGSFAPPAVVVILRVAVGPKRIDA